MSQRTRLKEQQEQAEQRRKDRRILAIVAVAVVVVLVGGGIAFQAWRTSRAPSAGPSASTSSTPVQIVNGQPVVLGSASAAAKIDLYEDFHCPHCKEFEDAYGSVLATALDKGQASLQVYPLAFIDQGSVSAANAFACAAEAGFGRAYFAGLFANQSLAWNDDQLISLATQVGGSASDSFKSCVTGKRHLTWLDSISAKANSLGVNSTPTVFFDGVRLDLSKVTPEQLAAKIDAAGK